MLEKERSKLSELRRAHYHLAGASEGWEEVSRCQVSDEGETRASPFLGCSPVPQKLKGRRKAVGKCKASRTSLDKCMQCLFSRMIPPILQLNWKKS